MTAKALIEFPDGKIRCQCLPSRCDRTERAVRAKSNLLNRFNLIWVVQPGCEKYSAGPVGQISGSTPPVCRDKRGDRDRHDRVVGCDGREGCDWRARHLRTAKSFGSDAPVLASSWRKRKPTSMMVATKPVTRTKSY